MTVEFVRTPDDQFSSLPGFNYQPNYLEDLPGCDGLRAHYVDEGPKDARHAILCLHGEPSWSYLYRKMIPVFLSAGHRVIAPDLFGFGRSDKPVDDDVYAFHFHRNYLIALIERLEISNITLVCQDWGGLLGLTLPMDMPDRFKRMIVMNTALAVGESVGDGFMQWKAFAAANPDMDVAALMQRASSILSDAEAAAYGAPFPDIKYKAGVRRFPEMVMISPEMEGVDTSKRAVEFFRNDWSGQCFMACGVKDPVLGPPAMQVLKEIVRNSSEIMMIQDAGHFVQEWGKSVAESALRYFGDV